MPVGEPLGRKHTSGHLIYMKNIPVVSDFVYVAGLPCVQGSPMKLNPTATPILVPVLSARTMAHTCSCASAISPHYDVLVDATALHGTSRRYCAALLVNRTMQCDE